MELVTVNPLGHPHNLEEDQIFLQSLENQSKRTEENVGSRSLIVLTDQVRVLLKYSFRILDFKMFQNCSN